MQPKWKSTARLKNHFQGLRVEETNVGCDEEDNCDGADNGVWMKDD
jgi:hypothetical protein